MVIKKKKLFYDIGIRYVWILCIYVVMSISLNEIVVRGNDYIAQVTDSMLTGKPGSSAKYFNTDVRDDHSRHGCSVLCRS